MLTALELGFGRLCNLGEDTRTDPNTLIRETPAAERSWRMQQTLKASENVKEAIVQCSKSDKQSHLSGFAECIQFRVNSLGHLSYPVDIYDKLKTAVLQQRDNPENFIRVSKGNGREMVGCRMQPGDYAVMQAAETLTLWFNFKPTKQSAESRSDIAHFERGLMESIHTGLLRLSGNTASTIRDDNGQMSQGARSATVSMVPLEGGGSAAADYMLTTQLRHYNLHPKQVAWVLNELKYDIAKTRALIDQHGPSLTAMNQAADAMLLLASDPAAMPQHPDTDLSAAAAAAARSSAAAAARNPPRTIVTLSFLPPPGSMSDDKMLRLIGAQSVSVLKDWLDEHRVSYQHCVEKQDIAQLILQTHKSSHVLSAAAAAAAVTNQPVPCDMSQWRHMALYYKAEAGEAAHGRTPAVVATFKAAVAAAKANDDELFGCLSGWNAVKAIVYGTNKWRVGDVLKLLDYAADCEVKLKGWNGYLHILPRMNVLKKPLRDKVQAVIWAARNLPRGRGRQPPSNSNNSSFRYNDIKSAKVRELVQPGDENLWITPDPALACLHTPAVVGKIGDGKKCPACKRQFHSLLQCSGCKSVQYCSKDCQKSHWKTKHKMECERMKAAKAAKAR